MQATYDAKRFFLSPVEGTRGWFSWLRGGKKASLRELMKEQPALAWALGELEALAEDLEEIVERGEDEIRISHRLAAHVSQTTADVLGLPPFTDLTLRCDLEGTPEDPEFRIICRWQRRGRDVFPKRVGAVLELAENISRLSGPLFEALQIAADMTKTQPLSAEERWTSLARFRQALQPLLDPDKAWHSSSKLDLVATLRDLEINLIDRFSLAINKHGNDFDIVPFSSHDEEVGDEGGHGVVSKEKAALSGGDLYTYQAQIREQGARHVMRLGHGRCVVTDADMLPAFKTAARFLKAPPEERRQFITNPRPYISEAIEAHLRQKGRLDDLTPEGVEEVVSRFSDRAFLETREYADRVKGVGRFERVSLPPGSVAESTWVPEDIRSLTDFLGEMDFQALSVLEKRLREARDEGLDMVNVDGQAWPVSESVIKLVKTRLATLQLDEDGRFQDETDEAEGTPEKEKEAKKQPLVLLTYENLYDLLWRATWKPRAHELPVVEEDLGLASRLHKHQADALQWQAQAWMAGAPGLLNADEQGLGKTLETLAFIRWLGVVGHGVRREAPDGVRVLVVAPVSLLRNWEEECCTHLQSELRPSFVRLYGSYLKAFRRSKVADGNELKSGLPLLDLSKLESEANKKKDTWFITSYDTLVNYQHSLGSLSFHVVIFDEIQALKNPATLRHAAARAVNADFRIGLTGTPIENTVGELWAIMDVLAPGALGLSLSEFLKTYGDKADKTRLAELKSRLFEPVNGLPPLALRRLKSDVAKDLPRKIWRLYPAFMPPEQQQAYDRGVAILAEVEHKGQHLKFLQHIRSASLHPCLVSEEACKGDLVPGSARFRLLAEVLDEIREKDERVLIFLESRQLQYQLAEWLAARYGLGRVGIINGETPIDKRRRLVEYFQSHLNHDRGFDILILAPRAAGAGLTLTAACHVIHLSRWWNPAVEDQCTDRVHRIGQIRDVTVHIPMALHPQYWERSFDFTLQELLMTKRRLSYEVLWPMGDTQEDVTELFNRTTRPVAEIEKRQKENLQDILLSLQNRIEEYSIISRIVGDKFLEYE